MPLRVLLHLVEHDDGVVQGVAEDRQQADHRGGRDLEAGERVDADGDHEVVDQGDQRGHRHPPLEVDRQEDRHQDDEDDQALERLLGDLLAPGRADHLDLDLLLRHAAGVGERRRRARSSPPASATRSGRGRCRWRSRVTMAWAPVAVSAVTRACSTEQVAFGMVKSAPPRNSMPRLRPRSRSAPTATRMITAETMYQVLLRPTKSTRPHPSTAGGRGCRVRS